jgi:hypothetical protein
MAIRDIARYRVRGKLGTAGRVAMRTLMCAAVVYLAFLGSWGLNYRRVPLAEKLGFDLSTVSADTVRALAVETVDQVNALYEEARRDRPHDPGVVDSRLADAFASVQELLGVRRPARPARPKQSLLDPYFRAAAVQGMTAPFFLETLIPSDLLPVEQPSVVAHEWSHLAGFADEGEAGFVAWLTCLRASPGAVYSGWLLLYVEAANALPPAERREIAERLSAGPTGDLRAIAARWNRNVSPTVASAGWEMYDRYLRANRVEAGTRSYAQVLGLVVGTELGRQNAVGKLGS